MIQSTLFLGYCIDTCSLVDLWRRFYPPDVFQTLWRNDLETLVCQGLLIAPQEVFYELNNQEDDLFEWAKDHKKMFKDLDEVQVKLVREIVKNFPKLVDVGKTTADADPFIIALAKSKDWTVVTSEIPDPQRKKPKIPDVCQVYDVKCIPLVEFFREQGWRY
jgi:hypothetical protein